jgi:hypothetical protein
MNHMTLRALLRAASLGLATASVLMPSGPTQAAGAIRAAYVEAVIPSKPFSVLVTASHTLTPFVGPSVGVLGVTSLVLSNGTSRSSGVTLNVVSVPDSIDCEHATLFDGIIYFRVAAYVPPLQTLQLTYPSPWVIGAGLPAQAGQHMCLAFEILDAVSSITVHVSGLVN